MRLIWNFKRFKCIYRTKWSWKIYTYTRNFVLFAFNDVKSELSELEFTNNSFEDATYGIDIGDDLVIKNIKKS